MEGMMRCALCGAGADVHCAADNALLCAPCDAEVHGANFLASRHRRTRVSATAKGRHDDDDISGTSSPTSCLSTADSATTAARQQAGRTTKPRARRTHRERGEAVLEGWAKQMGVGAARQRAAAAARSLQHVAVAPRVAMAAALWREVAARRVQEADGDPLRRLEACAGVSARMVVAVASAMGRRARVKQPAALDTEEGWGECS